MKTSTSSNKRQANSLGPKLNGNQILRLSLDETGALTAGLAQYLLEELPTMLCCLKQTYCESDQMPASRSLPTFAQQRILLALSLAPRGTTELAKLHQVSLPAISRMIHQLIEQNLVKKVLSPKDKRQSILTLTKEGRKSLNQSQDTGQQRLFPILNNLSLADRRKLDVAFKILKKLTQNMKSKGDLAA